MDRLRNTGQDTYRLIVTRRNGSEVLLSGRDNSWSLPSVGISQRQRIADQLCAKLYAQSGFRGLLLVRSHPRGRDRALRCDGSAR